MFHLPLKLVALLLATILNVLPAVAEKPDPAVVVPISPEAKAQIPSHAPPINAGLVKDADFTSRVSANGGGAPEQKSLPGLETAPSVESYLPKMTNQMVTYSRIHYALYFVWTLLDVLCIWVFLQFGWAHKLAEFARSRSHFLIFQLAIFVLGFALYLFIAALPLTYYSGFWLEHHYGLSSQSLPDWLFERGKHFLLGLSIEIPLWWLLYKTVRRFQRVWPLVLFGISIPVILALVFAAPLLFDPLFNKFSPLPGGRLRAQIETLAAQCGLSGTPVFVCDRSKQTNKINAYVTGIGSSARIVVWDTTLKRLPEDQVLAVVAHELGHYVLRHIYWGCAIAVAISLALVPVNMLWTSKLFVRLPKRWEIRALDDIGAIPALVLIATLVSFVADPIDNAYSRKVEHEADQFGLHLTKDGPAMARTFVSLSEQNLSEPDPPPFIEFWLFSHPSLKERIEFALEKP
jgi:STE24 endopeptidase